MKTIYINESALKAIKEGVLKHNMPSDISNALLQHKTSVGNNPAIPDVFDTPYLYRLSKNRFEEIEQHLQEIGSIDDVEETDVDAVLGRLIYKCKQIEKGYKDELEKICFNYLVDLFGVPEETVQLILELKDKVDLNGDSILLDPADGEEIEFNDVNDAMSIRDEVYKRRMLDVLCMGAGMTVASKIDSYEPQISKLSPELCDLYNKVLWLSEYALYLKEDVGMTDRNKMQIGTVEVSLGQGDEQVRIHAQGEIFPVLLTEAIRGFMELFISHGLPQDKSRTIAVLGKADYLKAEPWDMRLGPAMWEKLSNSFNDISFEEIPYLMKRIATLDVNHFNFLMKEVLTGTKKGKDIMYSLCNKSKNDIEYDKFVDKMDKMKKDRGVISDEYLHEEELTYSHD